MSDSVVMGPDPREKARAEVRALAQELFVRRMARMPSVSWSEVDAVRSITTAQQVAKDAIWAAEAFLFEAGKADGA